MSKDLHLLSSYKFDLPEHLIANYPCTPRDHSRLMIVDRKSGIISEMKFFELKDFLEKDDSLVFNDTKVIPARLFGRRETGGIAEIFLTKLLRLDTWEALAKPGKKLKNNDKVYFGPDFSAEIIDSLDDGRKIVTFHYEGEFETLLAKYGSIPLPSYIKRDVDLKVDADRYQTVYAKSSGAVAAPTAGLHFTKELMDGLSNKGVLSNFITLHVGIGTFRPVQVDDIRQHKMHAEKVMISEKTAENLNAKLKNSRQICVGTTCCRSLESSVGSDGKISPGSHETSIFIYPGYKFKYVDHLLTNFHLPGSSLMMLVSAFAGYDLIMEAYQKAIKEKYRFFSYGDAMLII
jgi:S-adenosylmethionine:tRNA ribosyltransferase-isomerase